MSVTVPLLLLMSMQCESAECKERNARAEEGENDTVIVVTGTALPQPPGTPAYGSVLINQDRLTSEASNRLENILADVAGFQQFRRSDSRSANPSAQGATLRSLGGNASSRTLVLLDGVPQADPFFGYIPFNALSPDRLASARVTRGGGAGAFGAGAVAGIIELESAGLNSLPGLSAQGFYGSNDAAEISTNAAQSLGSGFVTVSGRYDSGDGFFTTPENLRDSTDVRAAYENWSAGIRGVAPLSDDSELQARMLVFRDDRTLRFAGADSESEGQDASLRFLSRGPWQIDALAYVQARNFSNVVISSTRFVKVLDQRKTPSTGLGGKLEIRPPVGDDHVLRFGVDTRISDGELFEDAFNAFSGAVTARRNAGGRNVTTGFFVEDDWTLGNLVLTGGVRADHWSIRDGFFRSATAAGVRTVDQDFAGSYDWQSSFRGGLLYNAPGGLYLRAAGYTGFRLPTLNELYRPFAVFPVVTQANENLDIEKLRGAEIGFDYTPSAFWDFSATVYINRLDDAIANVTLGPNLRQRQNVDSILAKGIELAAKLQKDAFSLRASGAYSDSKVRGSGTSAALDGLRPAQSPEYLGSATFAWQPSDDLRFSATLRYIGSQFEDDLESVKLPDALTLDAYLSVPLGAGFSGIGRAENIFDEKVVTRISGDATDLGTPQTFWIGLKFER